MFILRLESCQKYFQENCAFRDRVNPILKESTFDSIGTNSGVTNDVNFICVLFVLKFYTFSFFLVASPGGSSQCDQETTIRNHIIKKVYPSIASKQFPKWKVWYRIFHNVINLFNPTKSCLTSLESALPLLSVCQWVLLFQIQVIHVNSDAKNIGRRAHLWVYLRVISTAGALAKYKTF